MKWTDPIFEQGCERRSFQRISFREPVQIHFKHSIQFQNCLAKDLGEKGICLSLKDFVPLASELLISWQLPGWNEGQCTGKIVWISKYPFSEGYQAGVEFAPTASWEYFRHVWTKYLKGD